MKKKEPGLFLVTLVGANGYSQGNVYAKNLETGVFGPVCDDAWNLEGVKSYVVLYFVTVFYRYLLEII